VVGINWLTDIVPNKNEVRAALFKPVDDSVRIIAIDGDRTQYTYVPPDFCI
jgi:hypothetical protein